MALLLGTVLEKTVKPVRHLDEAFVLFLGAAFLMSVIKERHIKKDEIAIIVLTICMLILGFAGNFKHDLLHNKYLWCLDAFNVFKFIAASLGAIRIFARTKHNGYIIRYLALFSEIFIIFASFFLIIHCFFDINMSTDIRYSFRTYNFILKRVGEYYELGLYLLIIFFADLYVEKRPVTWLFIALTMLNMASTLRSRAFAYSVLFLLFYIVFVVLKAEKVRLRYMVPVVLAAAVAFAGQFVYYFSGNKARNVLLRYGVRIMKAYFPIGSGFGTYGAAVAKQYYSKLYIRYGFWQYYGTSMAKRSFLLDNYWPTIMAELGFFGAVFMLIVLLLLFRRNIRVCNNPYSRVCVYSCWVAMFISSTVSSAFLAGTKAMLMSALAAILVPIAAHSTESQKESRKCIIDDNQLAKLLRNKRLLLIAVIVLSLVSAVGILLIRSRIQNSTKSAASIVTESKELIYDGTGVYDPFKEGVTVKNARLKDISFRDKSVKMIREVTGERYSTLTDEEIEAVTGERVVNGRTKTEILLEDPKGERTDLSLFDNVMSASERDMILASSKALDQPFDLSGSVLKNVLSTDILNNSKGNLRDRYIYYYYQTYSNTKLRARRALHLEGYRIPAMLLPEHVPTVTREMLLFGGVPNQNTARKHSEFSNYFGISTFNGFYDTENKGVVVEQVWDPLRSQMVNLKFVHRTLYGLSVNRRIDVRVAGPEITLRENGVIIKKDAAFNPYDYVSSVRSEDGTDVRGLLKVDNPVRTDRPGFYTVTYSLGEESVIDMFVKVVA